MQIHQLKRVHKNKKSQQVGRGSKRGKTSGRGTKGQNARAGHKNRPEFRDIIKKLPKLRGRGKNSNLSIQQKPVVINVADLADHFEDGATINRPALLEKGLIELQSGQLPQVKILGDGELKKKLSFVGMDYSKAAGEKAGIKVKVFEVKEKPAPVAKPAPKAEAKAENKSKKEVKKK